ncbi:MAG: hypothetical protein HGA45_13530 [Chloroflexales bacterium]|nr:hypothetical protein [Chloroflexales bacterium]
MPDVALIEALDRLREGYTQRQKLSANLAAALKGTTSALGKASRTMRDYIERGQGAADAAPRALEALAASRLRDEAIDPLQPALRREVKLLTEQATALKDAANALRGEAVDVVKLGHALTALEASKLKDPAVAALLPRLADELDQGQQALGATFGLALRHALAERGITLEGRPPRFEIGPFELAADFVSRAATLSYGKNLVARRVPLSVEAVLKAYDREAKAITGRSENGAEWIRQLYAAWEIVRARRGGGDPRANIVECYYELVLLRQPRAFRFSPSKHSFVDYSRAQFAYDFYEFTGRNKAIYQGLRAFGTSATKSQTDNPERSIWIVNGDSPHAGNYISDVKFDKDE